ncbi:MAG TPA: exodeoxyribonuclease VII large subunit [Rhodocyclaceae bacterium]|nr:exodeoxyribonuclease VII large subunit [Rhodocyclaceae bacterium]
MGYNSAMATLPFPEAGGTQAIPVSTLNRLVKNCLESAFPLTWIGGEISNLTYAASGHVYFTLKDESAQVRCVMWRSRAQLLGWRLENGLKVEVRALVSFYEPRGEFQLNVETVRRAGQGDLFERFLRLKAKLEAEGLFDPAGKRPLPAFPRRIGIVTSPQAAALRDVLTTLKRRAPHVVITLYPTPVQGEGAGERIAAALELAAGDGNDTLILCRGGGSIEDLWAFNDEVVARAMRNSPVPVVSGVGHETDFTIADFAADLRAPTPTAAAELASPDRAALLARLDELGRLLVRRTQQSLADQGQRLDWLALRLVHPAERLGRQQEHLGRLADQLGRSLARQMENRRYRLHLAGQRLTATRPNPQRLAQDLTALDLRLRHASGRALADGRAKLQALAAGLTQLNPHNVLARGYAIAIGPDGQAVRDAARLAPGDGIRVTFARGSADAQITQVALPEEPK